MRGGSWVISLLWTRCDGDKHLTTAQSIFGHIVLEAAQSVLYKGVGVKNKLGWVNSTHIKENGGIGGGSSNQNTSSSTVKN